MQKKQAKAASESALFIVLLGCVVVAANLLGMALHFRADSTQNELFSLSEGSKATVRRLEDQVEARLYFSEDLPPPHNSTERYVQDLLAEYQAASGGNFAVRVIHPDTDESRLAAQRDGVNAVQDQVLEADSFSVKEGYRGLSIHYLGEHFTLPHIDTTAGLEYEITQGLKQLLGETQVVGVVGGHDGPSLAQGLVNLQGYLPTYELRTVELTEPVPAEVKALLIVSPEAPFAETELRYLDQYVMRGGSLGIFGGSLKLNVSSAAPTASPIDTGLNQLLNQWGLSLGDAMVADAQCSRARMDTSLGLPIAVPYPPAPVINFDAEQQGHPVTFRLAQIALPYTAPLELLDTLQDDSEVEQTVLARSTDASWLMTGDNISLASKERWEIPGYDGPFTVGVALSGRLPSAFASAMTPAETPEQPPIEAPTRAEKPVHVVVFGGGALLEDQFLPPPGPSSQVRGGGMAFVLNTIDWLANDDDLIAIRAKNVETPVLEVPQAVKEAKDSAREAYQAQDEAELQAAYERHEAAIATWQVKKDLYIWGNILAVPLAFALFGVIRWKRRRARQATLTL